MKTVSLSGSVRTSVGKTDANNLRRKGMVPCVLYGGKEQIHFFADERQFAKLLKTPLVQIVELDVDGKKYRTILQDAQFHKITDRIIHADFLEIHDDKPVTVHLPVKPVGQAEGVKMGGVMVVNFRKLKVKGPINKLPEKIEINVENLKIGKSISVADIKIDGVQILHPGNISVISVRTTRNVVQEEQATAATTTTSAPAAGQATSAKADEKKDEKK
ncbi:MAG: 50S ribosomal protein L25/general stress protein Ctc [Bacteroidia bacterium]|nr:50S ribosomal protein L25/general stress protein Ctc [Bacteroidia bacterium]